MLPATLTVTCQQVVGPTVSSHVKSNSKTCISIIYSVIKGDGLRDLWGTASNTDIIQKHPPNFRISELNHIGKWETEIITFGGILPGN